MAQSVNWLFIVLGLALGCPLGYGVCHMHIAIKRHRSHMRVAAPLLRLMAYAFGGFLILLGVGLTYIGVL